MFDKTFSNGKMSYVTIVDLAEMIKLGIQRFFIWCHLVSHLSKFDQVKFGQMKKQHFDSIMNSKWLQIKKCWIPSLFISSRYTIVVLVNFPFEKVKWFKFMIFKFRRLQTSFRNPRLSQIEKFWIPSLFSSSRYTIVVLVNFPFEKVYTVQISIMNSKWFQIKKFWIPSLLNSSRYTIVVLVNFTFEKVWIVQICDF